MTKYAMSRRLGVFVIVWFGQFISLIGSGLTSFAIDLWIYQKTGSVTQYALIALCTVVPPILLSPVAGAFVDRLERRLTMILSDCGAALATVLMTLLFFNDRLQIRYICILVSVISVCSLFQKLAFTAAISGFIPKKHLVRANAIVQIGETSTELFIPALAGILVLMIQVQGVLFIDFATYLFSLTTLFIVKFPKRKTPTTTDQVEKNSLKTDIIYGWSYIVTRPGVMGLLLYTGIINFLVGIVTILIVPMLVTFVSSATAGTVLSISTLGALVGSLVMSVWGGPKRRVYGIIGFGLLLGFCIFLLGLRPWVPLITAATFGGLFCFPFIGGFSEALLQSIVPLNVQGRVFAMYGMIASSSAPLAYTIAGPLADYVFEPLLASGAPLAGSIGSIIGVGAGRGIGLLFIMLGILLFLVTICSYSLFKLRLLEQKT